MNPSWIHIGRLSQTRLYHPHPCRRGHAAVKMRTHLASKSMTYVIARLLDLGRHVPVPHGISDAIRDASNDLNSARARLKPGPGGRLYTRARAAFAWRSGLFRQPSGGAPPPAQPNIRAMASFFRGINSMNGARIIAVYENPQFLRPAAGWAGGGNSGRAANIPPRAAISALNPVPAR